MKYRLAFMLVLLLFLGQVDIARYSFVYSKEVNGTIVINTPNDFMPHNANLWRSIGYFINHDSHKVFILNWAGRGGEVVEAHEFIYDIQTAEEHGKTIIIRNRGNSFSMHAVTFCYANVLIQDDNYFLMFHADSYIANGKDTRTHQTTSQINNDLNECMLKGIITQKDINMLWQGNEVYKYKYKTVYMKDPRQLER